MYHPTRKGKGVFERKLSETLFTFIDENTYNLIEKARESFAAKGKRHESHPCLFYYQIGRSGIMKNVSNFFGCKVFDDRVMKANLSAKVYQSLRKTIDEGAKLDIGVANAVAAAMKDWAVEHGATHYTHWFQPLTGVTAE